MKTFSIKAADFVRAKRNTLDADFCWKCRNVLNIHKNWGPEWTLFGWQEDFEYFEFVPNVIKESDTLVFESTYFSDKGKVDFRRGVFNAAPKWVHNLSEEERNEIFYQWINPWFAWNRDWYVKEGSSSAYEVGEKLASRTPWKRIKRWKRESGMRLGK